MTMFYALAVLCLSGSALAQIPSFGSCPNIEGQSNFDAKKMEGNWHMAARYFTLLEFRSKCNEADFTVRANGSIKGVHSFLSGYTRTPVSVELNFKPDHKNPARLTTLIPGTPLAKMSDCHILGTDYDSYAVLYCCTDYKYTNLRWSWIFTRDRVAKQSAIEQAYQSFEKNDVKRRRFWKVDQENCSREE